MTGPAVRITGLINKIAASCVYMEKRERENVCQGLRSFFLTNGEIHIFPRIVHRFFAAQLDLIVTTVTAIESVRIQLCDESIPVINESTRQIAF